MKQIHTPELRRGPEQKKGGSGFEQATGKIEQIKDYLHDVGVILSGNRIERDPLIIQDNQGRERVVTMHKRANQVSEKLKIAMSILAASGLLATVGATGKFVEKVVQPEQSSHAEKAEEGQGDWGLELAASAMDKFSDMKTQIEEIQKKLEAKRVKGAGSE